MAAATGITDVINWADMRLLAFPVSGAGSNIPVGTIMIPGTSGGTNKGVLIPCTATSIANALGLLAGPHNYAASGDALTQTLTQWFPTAGFNSFQSLLGVAVPSGANSAYPSHPIALYDTAVLVKMSYNQASTGLPVASATTTQINVSSEIANLDTSFLYFSGSAGAAYGSLQYAKSSTSGYYTLTATPTLEPNSSDYITRISPLFWAFQTLLINTTTVPTLMDSQLGLASGGARCAPIANFISLNGDSFRLDPSVWNNKTGLNKVTALDFYSLLAMQDTILHPNA